MASKFFLWTAAFLLILLWVYAAVSKLIDFGHFQNQMHNQMLYPLIQNLLIYILPPAELITAGMLMLNKTFLKGLYVSLFLLFAFTGYISLTLLHFFRHVPCSCGGILEHMGWTPHLFLNLFFLALTIAAILIIRRKEVV